MPKGSLPYHPKPIDTSRIELTEEVGRLTELLARNAHERWAEARMAEGWQWGPNRDESGKRHPCLVPYAKLPESEKEYDRTMARETLKALVALGYRLQKGEESAS